MSKDTTIRRYYAIGNILRSEEKSYEYTLAKVINYLLQNDESLSTLATKGASASTIAGEIYFKLIREGMESISNKISELGNDPNFSAYMKAKVERRKSLIETGHLEELVNLCRQLGGVNEFKEWADEHNIDQGVVDQVEANYEFTSKFGSSTDRVEQELYWLRNLLSDGNPVHTTQIRDFAEKDGLVTNDQEWNNLKNTASRYDYTGEKHAHWKLPKLEINY